MLKKTCVYTIVLLSMIFSAAGPIYAKKTIISLDWGLAGLSAIRGENRFFLGAAFSGNGFHQIHNNIYLGGRFAFDLWGPNIDYIEPDFSTRPEDRETSGLQYAIELVPSVRVVHASAQKVIPFLQLGLGYFFWCENAKIKATDYFGSVYENSYGDSFEKFGMNAGAGFTFTKKLTVEISLMFHMLFMSGETIKFTSLSTGIVL